MLILNDRDAVPKELRGAVIALGNFDGVHRGHQAVLERARRIAGEAGVATGVMTFEPHPRVYFKPSTQLFTLSPLPRKLALLTAIGLDFTCVLTFDVDLANQTAEAFIDQVLVERWAVSHVIVGYNFFFGKGPRRQPAIASGRGRKARFRGHRDRA